MLFIKKKSIEQGFYIFEKFIFPIYLSFFAVAKIYSTEKLSIIIVFDAIVRPLAVSGLLIISTPKNRVINLKIILGILMSYLPMYFFNLEKHSLPVNFIISIYASIFFYLSFLFYSMFLHGRNFTVTPSVKPLLTKGPYSLVRHPIYTSYIGIFLSILSMNFSRFNVILFFIFFIGIYIRATQEDHIIKTSKEGYTYIKEVPSFMSIALAIPIFFSWFIFTIEKFNKPNLDIHVNISYPVYSLSPILADDWSSFFVINHIYPRLLPDNGDFRSRSIFSSRDITCNDSRYEAHSKECKTIRFHGQLSENLHTCNNTKYNLNDFEYEISNIAKKKNWLLPNFKLCRRKKLNSACFTFDKHYNPEQVLRSIYLRFGWSKNRSIDTSYGISPTCFHREDENKGTIQEGTIRFKNSSIHISTKETDPDIYLYDNEIKTKGYSNLFFYNPISYFLIVNKKSLTSYPIFLQSFFIDKLSSLMKKNVILDEQYLHDESQNNFKKIKQFEKKTKNELIFVLPNFLKNCPLLKDSIQSFFYLNELNKTKVVCGNTTELINQVITKQYYKWDAYITPLTPGLPGKDALKFQYFSSGSTESLVGNDVNNLSSYFLLGTSTGSIRVKKEKICNIKSNPLGLSDITIDDFVLCN